MLLKTPGDAPYILISLSYYPDTQFLQYIECFIENHTDK